MSHWTQPYIRSSPKLAVFTSLASLGTMGAEDLAAFFTDNAVWHNIPLAPVTGRDNIATSHRLIHHRHREHRVPRAQHRQRRPGRAHRAG